MSISSVFFGRVPDALVFEQQLARLDVQQRELLRLETQLTSGLEIQLPSEAPATAQRALALQNLLERNAQLQANVDVGQGFLAASESVLNEANSLLNDALGIALSSVGDTVTQEEKENNADVLGTVIEGLLGVANRQFRDRYLFSGHRADQPAFVQDGAFILYAGDTGQMQTIGDAGQLFSTNITGDQAFGGVSAPQGTVDLNPVLTLNTRLSGLNGGSGVARGQIEISDGTTTSVIDLEHAETVGDVIGLIQAGGPAGINAAINAAGDGLEITLAAGTLTVEEVGLGRTAADLGILAETPVGLNLVGQDVDPALTLTTQLADLRSGAGIDQAGGMLLSNGGQQQVIDISAAQTVEDLLNLLNGSGLSIAAGLNSQGNGLEVSTLLSGTDFSLGENGGTTATDLGLRTLTAQTLVSDLNFGTGVSLNVGPDVTITRKDGVVLDVDLDGASTMGDVLTRINSHANNADGDLVAQLVGTGNGIELVDSTGGAGNLVVTGSAADGLGIAGSVAAPGTTLTGSDPNRQEPAGVFNTLLRLRDALMAGDDVEISRMADALQEDIERVSLARGDLGGRMRSAEFLANRLADEEVELRRYLSDTIDADLAEVLASLQSRQVAFQAALQFASLSLRTSLIEFL